MGKGMRAGLLLALLVMVVLSGCTQVATTSAQAVYNRHSLKKQIGDEYITMQAFRELKLKRTEFDDANIAIATYNNEVLLAGQAPHPWQKKQAEEIIKSIPEVGHIYNLVTIGPPSSPTEHVKDSWITTKIKSKLIASDDIDSTKIKVVTENGIVYLMGVLLPEEANTAVEIARTTDGVKTVVRIFSYITISKTLNKHRAIA